MDHSEDAKKQMIWHMGSKSGAQLYRVPQAISRGTLTQSMSQSLLGLSTSSRSETLMRHLLLSAATS